MIKKVLIFSLGYYPRHVGGAEVAIKEITDRINENEIEFHLLCNRYDSTLPRYEQMGNVHVHRIGIATRNPQMADLRKFPLHLNKVIYQIYAYWVARRLHRQYRFDAIWAMMAHSCAVPAGMFKNTYPEVKYLLTLQEGDPPEHIVNKMKPFGKLFPQGFSRADMLQPISQFLERWGREMGFTGKSEIIPNAVNTEHFMQEYSEEELQKVRQEIGKKEGDVFIVTTSRLVKKNGINDVIDALVLLPEHVKFLVFGTGPDLEKLQQQVSQLSLEDRVNLYGFIDHAIMPQYLKACDIFTRPSLSEGFGNSFVEAMAAQLPVIATQEGGIADFLFDEERNPDKKTTGWAVDAQSPDQIARAVEDIMKRPNKVAEVVATAQEMAVTQYDWNLIAEDMCTRVFGPLMKDKI